MPDRRSKAVSRVSETYVRAQQYKQDSNTLLGKAAWLFNHLLLLAIYSVYTVIRTFQYLKNKTRLKVLTLAYNPSQTPQIIREDALKLEKLPKRLSTILELKSEEEEGGGFYGLLNDAAEVVAWTAASGIPSLSIYEKDGILKSNVKHLKMSIYKKLMIYFGPKNVPKITIKIPRLQLTFGYKDMATGEEFTEDDSKEIILEVLLLSEDDGKPTMVELTKTMAELVKRKEISIKDITMEVIDGEITELIGNEPDLIILFSPTIDLRGYPPWQIRLSEIYWEPDNDEVNYAIFLRGLQKYSTCKINVGK